MDQDAVATQRAPAMAASHTRVAPPPPPPPTMLAPMAETYEAEPEEEEEERKSRVGLAILVTAVIVLVLGGGAFALYRILTPEQTVQTVEVPDVTTYTEEQATEQLVARGLKVEVKRENGEEDTKGTITDQDPKAGVIAEVNSTVTITLNTGPKTDKIPGGLVGKDVDEVEEALREAGFDNVDTNPAKNEDPDTEPNQVLSVSPKSGSTAPLDSKVTVTYATGKSPMPNFVGLLESRARDLAEESGFDSVQVVSEVSNNAPPGVVIRQNPQAEAVVDRTTKIRLVIAEAAPPPTTQPPSTPPSTPVPSGSPSPSGSVTPG
jgi:serine/threonine-protein kinase